MEAGGGCGAVGPAQSGLEGQILELEAQKTAAFDRDDMEECARLRAKQMELLEQAQPGSKGAIGDVPSEELSGQLQREVASVMEEVEELATLRQELQADLEDFKPEGSARVRAPEDARAETMRAVAELEQLKRRLMDGRSLQECGIEDDDCVGGVGGWCASASPSVSQHSRTNADHKEAREVAFAAATTTDTEAMMAEMEQLNAEMDAELASLSAAVSTAKAQRKELSGMHDQLLQQFEETRQEMCRSDGSVNAKAF